MFDISPDDILRLDDEQLRELVARLAAAEAQRLGHSPLCITWGGNQTAPDGGLDVDADIPAVALPSKSALPRPRVGFQVKKPDMPPAEIKAEMRPKGVLRSVLADLAAVGGAYIIVSSAGSTAYGALKARRKAMRDALHDCPKAAQLHTDFFDRTRLADWVRDHPGLVLWVREKVGRVLDGWHSYGPWSHPRESVEAPYLVDDRLRVHVGARGTPGVKVTVAIDHVRQQLAEPRKAVRLVGLSGVGKTRFVQALFDGRIGHYPLAKDSAVYTDMAANPTPQPVSLATDLIAQRRQAVLVIDNCGSLLHGQLAQVCAQADSKVSLISVEYDVREDIPEDTEVVTMDTSSGVLIEQLVLRRYPKLSRMAAQTIADVADGNARIALAIAGAVGYSENLTQLSSKALFDRLFWQRHQEDKVLLRAAQACALVYSFNAELEDGVEAELPRLANLINQNVGDMHAAIVELERRELMQRRAEWRAVLPHALANYLATRALEEIQPVRIRELIINSGNLRLLRSFTRRLSYLHGHRVAENLCTEWLQPGGMLGDVSAMTYREEALFENVASVVPAVALLALERVATVAPANAPSTWRRQCKIVRAIAYDAALFDRCVALLLQPIMELNRLEDFPDLKNALVTFFQIVQSGTHAPVSRRFALIEEWLASPLSSLQALGRAALQRALSTTGISTSYGNSFGARSHDYGYQPANNQEVSNWFGYGLQILDQLAVRGGTDAEFANQLLPKLLSPLWAYPALRDQLETQMLRCGAGTFWLEGWVACREASRVHHDDAESVAQLSELCGRLAPKDLAGEAVAAVMPNLRPFQDMLPDESYKDYERRTYEKCEALGAEVATQPNVLVALAPKFHRTGGKAALFGQGLAKAAQDLSSTWHTLVKAWSAVPIPQQNPALLRGFITSLALRDAPLAQQYLAECLANTTLTPALAALQDAVGWDEEGVERLGSALAAELIAVEECHYLYSVVKSTRAVQQAAAELVAQVAARPRGFSVAVNVLARWITTAELGSQEEIERLRPTCHAVLAHAKFGDSQVDNNAYEVARIAKIGLVGAEAEPLTRDLALALRDSSYINPSSSWENQRELLQVMLQYQPGATLSALCEGGSKDWYMSTHLFHDLTDSNHPAKSLDPAELVAWCNQGCRARRHAFALKIIPAVEAAATPGRARLTSQARALLEHSPFPKATLKRLVSNLSPWVWSGSRATIMEVNATALDDVLHLFDAGFQNFARHAKAQLLATIAVDRDEETKRERTRDERFE